MAASNRSILAVLAAFVVPLWLHLRGLKRDAEDRRAKASTAAVLLLDDIRMWCGRVRSELKIVSDRLARGEELPAALSSLAGATPAERNREHFESIFAGLGNTGALLARCYLTAIDINDENEKLGPLIWDKEMWELAVQQRCEVQLRKLRALDADLTKSVADLRAIALRGPLSG